MDGGSKSHFEIYPGNKKYAYSVISLTYSYFMWLLFCHQKQS